MIVERIQSIIIVIAIFLFVIDLEEKGHGLFWFVMALEKKGNRTANQPTLQTLLMK